MINAKGNKIEGHGKERGTTFKGWLWKFSPRWWCLRGVWMAKSNGKNRWKCSGQKEQRVWRPEAQMSLMRMKNSEKLSVFGLWWAWGRVVGDEYGEVARHKSYVTLYTEKKFEFHSIVSMEKMKRSLVHLRHVKDYCFHKDFNQSS